MVSDILTKVFSLATLAFLVAFFTTPLLTKFLFKYKLGKQIRSGPDTPVFTKMHAKKQGTPTMGGILVWGTTLLLVSVFWFLDRVTNIEFFHTYNFLTRRETLLPLGAFVGASVVGLVDDFLDIRKLGHNGRGLRFRFKVLLYAAVAVIGAWWFYYKLTFDSVHIPFLGDVFLGWLFIPFFILAVVGVSFAVNLTDGLDGLAGGTLMIAFFALGLIAFLQGRENLTAFIAVICGALLAFLWFNVFPARFFMGDTGSMGLGVLLAIVAFLTDTFFLLPFIGFIFMIEAGSFFIQIFSKQFLGKKVLISAPVHHHLEALGWPESKVTMRFWIIASVTSIIGVIVYFVGK